MIIDKIRLDNPRPKLKPRKSTNLSVRHARLINYGTPTCEKKKSDVLQLVPALSDAVLHRILMSFSSCPPFSPPLALCFRRNKGRSIDLLVPDWLPNTNWDQANSVSQVTDSASSRPHTHHRGSRLPAPLIAAKFRPSCAASLTSFPYNATAE